MRKAKIGLLPLYIELYDKSFGSARPRMDQFYGDIASALRKQGMDVETVPVCRLEGEFKKAIRAFEKADVDAVVTLHLAYSPSLESSEALAATKLPIIVLDTTPAFDFGPGQSPDEIMYNHGIHGVQDMCNLLIRNGKAFEIVAGHWKKSDVLDRVSVCVKSAQLVRAMRTARVGCIGSPFKGMGDFAVAPAVMKRTIGLQAIRVQGNRLAKLISGVSKREISAEVEADRKQFKIGKLDGEVHRRTARVSIGVRRWIEQDRLTAFTVNFLAATRAAGLATVPFLEASKGMARGIGYAGEGDILTAALVGAMASVYPDTSFTEMFCPDWKGNRIYLSHMGELNTNLVDGKPTLMEMDYNFSDTANPVRAVGCFRGGEAVFVNLAPLPGERYRLILAPVKMEKVVGKDRMANTIHGWFKPATPVDSFLAEYSRQGGTHHAALVYGHVMRELAGFARFMGWETVELGSTRH